MATHIVQFRNPGPRGGEYNVPVTAQPGATDEQIVNQAIAKANRPLAKMNRLGNELGTNPTVIPAAWNAFGEPREDQQ